MRAKVLLSSFLLIVLLSCGGIVSADSLAGFSLAAENQYLELYLNEDKVEFAVRQKASGEIWFSNPVDRDKKETVAGGSSKQMLNSQLILTYFVSNQQRQMDSYNDSVIHDQYEIVTIPNGFRIDYDIGRTWQDADYLPSVISEEKFNNLLDRIENEKDRQFLRKQYALFTLEEGYVDSDTFSILGVDLPSLLGDYGLKVLENFRANDKRRLFQEYLVLVRDGQGYDSLGQVTPEDISGLLETPTLMLRWNVMQWDKERAMQICKDHGYTPEDVTEDHLMYGAKPPYPDLRSFQVSVEYVLDGPTLIARILGESIVYPDKVYDIASDDYVSYPLTQISLLSYFGASDVDSEGYILVPDGSGALIYTNNGKTNATPYTRPVYGRDLSASPVAEYSSMLKDQIHLPVFGLKDGDKAFFAVIEEGDAMASLAATVSGMRDSFNKVWATFNYIPQVRVYMEAEGELIHLRTLSLNMYQSRPYQGNMTVRYHFLTDDKADYASMATLYQDYLVRQHGLQRIAPTDNTPLILDTVGSIDVVRPVLGIPSNVVVPLTTFREAEDILQTLLDAGVSDIVVRYLGWLKGGINHIYPTKARLEDKVGRQADFRQLTAFASQRGIELYPDVSFTEMRRDKMLDRYLGLLHAPRFLNRKQAHINVHNIASYQPVTEGQVPLISPRQLPGLVESFLADYAALNLPALSAGSLGHQLFSDFRVDTRDLVDRQEARSIVIRQAQLMAEQGVDLMLERPNSYLLPYAKYVVNAPMYSHGSEIVDVSVPFYQMVISGYMGYGGRSANLADQTSSPYLLKMLETGSLPVYTIAAAPTSKVKHTSFDYLYSISFTDVSNDILLLYEAVNPILAHLWHLRIVDHNCLSPNVFATEYEDGTIIIVNYNQESVWVEDREIPAQDYVLITEQKGW